MEFSEPPWCPRASRRAEAGIDLGPFASTTPPPPCDLGLADILTASSTAWLAPPLRLMLATAGSVALAVTQSTPAMTPDQLPEPLQPSTFTPYRSAPRATPTTSLTLACEGLFYVPPQSQRSALAEALGCELERVAYALVVKNDPTTRETTVPGVYAAGDVTGTGPLQSVPLAAASGAAAAYFANHALVASEDVEAELSALAGGVG